jgi:hypothetical protein
MKLNIDYRRTEAQIAATSNVGLTCDYIEYAITKKYPTLKGQMLRVFSRLQRKFEDAVEKNLESIELDATEIDMIKESFKDVEAESRLAKYMVILMEEVDKLGKEEPAATA